MNRRLNHPKCFDLRCLEKIANGKQRNIFLVNGRDCGPDFPDVPIVLKVPRRIERQNRLSPSKRFLRRLYPASSLRVISKEVDYLTRASQDCADPLCKIPIPTFMGFVETSDGTGVLWEAICDEQGQLASTLKNLVDENRIAEALEPLNSFVKKCLKTDLVVTDMNYRNLVYGHKSGKKQFFIVDGFGDHRMFSLREMSHQYNHGKLMLSFKKISQQTSLTFDNQTNSFCLGTN